MTSIRPFVADDIPQVSELHDRVFAAGSGNPSPLYRPYFENVFLGRGRSELFPSLVYEEDDRVVGFIGLLPRRMRMNGEPVCAAICTQFMVDPARRGLVGLRLLRTVLNGKQDLALTDEANDLTRRIWEGLGGSTALPYSTHWFRPLRPASFGLFLLKARGRFLLRPLLSSSPSQLGRSMVRWMIDKPGAGLSQISGDQLTKEALLAHFGGFFENGSLRSDYDENTLEWLLNRAAERKGEGSLQMTLVRNGKQEVAGWYVYYAHPGEIGQVLQIMAKKNSVGLVLDHLFWQAKSRGTTAVAGRVEPRFAAEFSTRNCLFHHYGPWMLVHSRRPDLIGPFLRGEAFVSRLDGEWCLRFQ